jgi:hypothetical protein
MIYLLETATKAQQSNSRINLKEPSFTFLIEIAPLIAAFLYGDNLQC